MNHKEESTDKLEKRIKIRNIIGWIINLPIIAWVFYYDLDTTIIFMVAVPTVAIIIWLNSHDEPYKLGRKNEARFTFVAILLAIVGAIAHYNQLDMSNNMNDATRYCYEQSRLNEVSSNVCDEITGILRPDLYGDE